MVANPPPDRKPAMFQSWRHLLFLHWEIAPEVVAESLPEGLAPDLHEGHAYLGIVPFFMRKIRPRGLPCVPWISNFLELNVRSYVLGPDGVPGVWFHSLDTNRRIARLLGRGLFHLPYYDACMSATVGSDGLVRYRAQRLGAGEEAAFSYRAWEDYRVAASGTLEEYFLERYSLFSWNARRRRLQRGRVHHRTYEYAAADVSAWSRAPAGWNGIEIPDAPPLHACVTRDVDVLVYALEDV